MFIFSLLSKTILLQFVQVRANQVPHMPFICLMGFPLAFYMKNIKPTKLVKKQLQQMHIYQLDSTINKLLYVFYQISIHLYLHSICPIFWNFPQYVTRMEDVRKVLEIRCSWRCRLRSDHKEPWFLWTLSCILVWKTK